jgi:hypothetical protein
LEREPNQRSAFEQACAGDEDLRDEVQSLLLHHEQAESLISAPALNVAAQDLAEDQGRPLVGKQIGSYKVLLLGRGGMGEVYRARDSKLNREVALKLLPEVFAGDAECMARFHREAHVLASLNHPNIAIIYGLEESNRVRAGDGAGGRADVSGPDRAGTDSTRGSPSDRPADGRGARDRVSQTIVPRTWIYNCVTGNCDSSQKLQRNASFMEHPVEAGNIAPVGS